MPADSKETNLGGSNQEAFPSIYKNMGEDLVPWYSWKCVPTAIFGVVNIPNVPGRNLLRQISSREGHKENFKDWCLINSQLSRQLHVQS